MRAWDPVARAGRAARRRAGWRRSRRRSTAPTPPCSSPSGRSCATSTGRRSAARRCARRVFVDGRNMLDPETHARGRLRRTRASAAPLREPARRHPRRRPGHAAAAADRADARRTCSRSSTGRCSRTRSSTCAGRRRRARSSRAATCRRRSRSTSATRYGDLALEYRVEEEPLGTGGAIRFAAEGLDETVLRAERRLAARGRPRRARSTSTASAAARRRSCSRRSPIRAATGSSRARRRPRAQLPREAAAGGDRHEPDQRRPLRARAGRARARSRPAGRSRSSARSSRSSCEEEAVYGLALPGYWLDVGTPEAYLQAHRDVLERNFVTELGDELGSDYTLVADGAEVQPGGAAGAAGLRRRGRADRRRARASAASP